MGRRLGKCYIVHYLDGSRMRVHAESKKKIYYISAEPSSIVKIAVQGDNGYNGKSEDCKCC